MMSYQQSLHISQSHHLFLLIVSLLTKTVGSVCLHLVISADVRDITRWMHSSSLRYGTADEIIHNLRAIRVEPRHIQHVGIVWVSDAESVAGHSDDDKFGVSDARTLPILPELICRCVLDPTRFTVSVDNEYIVQLVALHRIDHRQ